MPEEKSPGKPLKVVCKGSEINCQNNPEPHEPPTKKQIESAKEFRAAIAMLIEQMIWKHEGE